VIVDDDAAAIMHEAPECSRFGAFIAQGPKPDRSEAVTEPNVDTHLAELAARRRARMS
jgi:hypothetical protein